MRKLLAGFTVGWVLLLAFACTLLSCGVPAAQGTSANPAASAPADGVAVSPYDDYVTVFISNQGMAYARVYVSEYQDDQGFRIASVDAAQTQRVVLRIHPDRTYCVTVSELAGETRMIGCVDLQNGMSVKITIANVLGFSTVVPGWPT